MAKHTPGPWAAFWKEENARLGIGSWCLAHREHDPVLMRRVRHNNQTAEANASLIAAAPELLEHGRAFFNEACAIFDSALIKNPNAEAYSYFLTARAQFQAAIAKAEGRNAP